MDETRPKTIIKGKYRHSKTGNIYEVIGVALHSETSDQLVVYRAVSYSSEYELFARPYEMFIEMVEINGQMIQRFEKVTEE